MKTTTSYFQGIWTCNTCGYEDKNGYPIFCKGCIAENTTSSKRPDKDSYMPPKEKTKTYEKFSSKLARKRKELGHTY